MEGINAFLIPPVPVEGRRKRGEVEGETEKEKSFIPVIRTESRARECFPNSKTYFPGVGEEGKLGRPGITFSTYRLHTFVFLYPCPFR